MKKAEAVEEIQKYVNHEVCMACLGVAAIRRKDVFPWPGTVSGPYRVIVRFSYHSTEREMVNSYKKICSSGRIHIYFRTKASPCQSSWKFVFIGKISQTLDGFYVLYRRLFLGIFKSRKLNFHLLGSEIPIYLSIYLTIYLSIYLSINLSIYLSIFYLYTYFSKVVFCYQTISP